MDAVLDNGFTRSFRNKVCFDTRNVLFIAYPFNTQVLHHILPLFPDSLRSPHSLPHPHSCFPFSPILDHSISLVPAGAHGLNRKREQLAIACQVALNLVKGGTQDYLGAVCSVLLEQAANTEESLQNLAFARLRLILGGETSVLLYGDLLERNNHADQLILKDT